MFTTLKRTTYDQLLQAANVFPQRHNARDFQCTLLFTIRSQGRQTNSQLAQTWHSSQQSNLIIVVVEYAFITTVSQL
jgi:multimeric flavodoxin WrbA